jgi:predicted dehydrogenase
MVRMCHERRVKLMVNQQARWAPAHRAVKVLIDRGIGDPSRGRDERRARDVPVVADLYGLLDLIGVPRRARRVLA